MLLLHWKASQQPLRAGAVASFRDSFSNATKMQIIAIRGYLLAVVKLYDALGKESKT